MAIIPDPLLYCNISSTFTSVRQFLQLSRYILAARVLVLLYLSSRTTLSLSLNCLISTASMLSLAIIMAARLLFVGYVCSVSSCNSCCFVLN
jgi:hypothetical protein